MSEQPLPEAPDARDAETGAASVPLPPEHIHTHAPCGRLGPHTPHVWLTRRGTWCEGGGEPGQGAAVHPRSGQADAEEPGDPEVQPEATAPEDAGPAQGTV